MIVLLCAMPREARHLRTLPAVRHGRVRLICSGIGPQHAEIAARHLLAQTKPSLVISTGVAGALAPSLAVGDILLATEVVDGERGGRIPCSPISSLAGTAGILVSVPRFILDPAEKAALASRFGAAAVDMESAAVGRVCAAQGVPFAVVRAISDTARQTLPSVLPRFYDAEWKLRPSRLASTLVKNPGLIGPLRVLQKQTVTACESLRRCLAALGSDDVAPVIR